MSKSILDTPPVGVEQAMEHAAHALTVDGWDEGQVTMHFHDGKLDMITRHFGGKCSDFFVHDGERWGRRTEYESEGA